MRIAQIAPINCRVSKEGSRHGTCNIIGDLTSGLIKKKHNVTIFGSQDSESKARIISRFKKIIKINDITTEDIKSGHIFPVLSMSNTIKAYRHTEKFDIIHSHSGSDGQIDSIFLAPFANIPTVSTLHCPLSELAVDVIKENHKNQIYVGISRSQLSGDIFFKNFPVIYHGIDVKKYQFRERYNDNLFFAGRLHPQKGVDIAVKVTAKTNKKIKLIGKIPADQQNYYDKKIKPYLNKKIQYIGELTREELVNNYMNSKAFIFPIQWEEPFGLVMIEAMACGTPVIAFARGSVPEIVKDGETGFIVNSSDKDKRGNWIIKKTGIAGLTEAVKRIYSMPEDEYRKMRLACRKRVEENFTVEKMVDNYERVYKEVIADWNKKHKI